MTVAKQDTLTGKIRDLLWQKANGLTSREIRAALSITISEQNLSNRLSTMRSRGQILLVRDGKKAPRWMRAGIPQNGFNDGPTPRPKPEPAPVRQAGEFETVDEFLARGGHIEQLPSGTPLQPLAVVRTVRRGQSFEDFSHDL